LYEFELPLSPYGFELELFEVEFEVPYGFEFEATFGFPYGLFPGRGGIGGGGAVLGRGEPFATFRQK
jgi:hypothetical protein